MCCSFFQSTIYCDEISHTLNARDFLHQSPVCTWWGGRKKGQISRLQRGCSFPASLHLTSSRKSLERMLLRPMLSLLKWLYACFLNKSPPWLSVWPNERSNWCLGHGDMTAAELANMGKHQHLLSTEVQTKTAGEGSKPKFEIGPAFGQATN